MNWIITESHNILLILCGIFYSVLCVFSLVTGLIYASGRKKLNPLELSDNFLKKLSDDEKMKRFTIKMGWVTFIVGIIQGLTAFAIFKGYNVFLNIFAIGFTIFSICSVAFKLKGKVNAFPMIKLIFYIIILIVLIINGVKNYSATDNIAQFLKSSENVQVIKIDEGYFFDGLGNENAIIFFPGARIQYTAYAKLMFQLAKSGQDCFLISAPMNLAFFSANTPEKIMKKYNYKNWYISGHSLGGVIACAYASDKPENIKGIICLASYPSKQIPSNMTYISIYGSEDKILNKEKYEDSKKYLPNGYKEYMIEGGNHSGFADYGEQQGDGKAMITNDKQKELTVEKMIEINDVFKR